MSKRFRAAVIGGSGYGGGEMIRRLLLHPNVELARVASIDFVDEPLSSAHPNLIGQTELTFENITPAQAASGCDVALLGLPHKVTAAKVPELIELGVKIVDMSGDFRLSDARAYAQYYGVEHPHPELLDRFVYGLPELNADRIRDAECVASPGCFATTIELALLPLARAGLLSGAVHVNAVTGSSGSGAIPSAGTHHPTRAVNLKTYKPLVHQHTPEIGEALTAAGATDLQLRFIPVSAPLSRGIFVTAFVEIAGDIDETSVASLFDDAYADAPFVRRPTSRLPEVAAVSGSNYAEVGFAVGERRNGARTVACFAALDNLIKGGAGQAIQSMNLALGLDQTLSLQDSGQLAVIVIKLGGELIESDAIVAIAADIATLAARGEDIAIVHGGGPQATAMQTRLGIQPNVVAGRRITDAATLDVMKMVVGGRLNIALCSALVCAGARPVGLHGASSHAVRATRRPPTTVAGGGPEPIDFGHVGDVAGFNDDLLRELIVAGYMPVIACLGADDSGEVLNINADVVATRLAVAVAAAHLVLITGARGVLRDASDPSSRIASLTIDRARAAIADGTVRDGMIPKIEETIRALEDSQLACVHIVGKLQAGELLRELQQPGAIGTAITAV